MKFRICSIILTTALVVPVATAAPADEVSNKVYEVGDLLTLQNDPSPIPPSSRNPATAEPAAGQESLETLTHLIEESVEPDTWKDNGGQIASTHLYGTQLIIAQTDANHERIAKLLGAMRAGRSTPMVSIRAYWLTLDPSEIAQLTAAPTANHGGAAGIVELATVPASFLLPPHLYSMAQGVGFNARSNRLSAARESSFVRDYTPIVGSNAVGYQATMDTARSGVTLVATPQLLPDQAACILDLQSQIEEKSVAPTTQPAAGAAPVPGDPQGIVQEIKSAVRVPLGRCVLLSGTTVNSSPIEGSTRAIFLAIQVDAVQP